MTQIDFRDWTKATGDLKPGVQRVFLDVLNLVKDEKVHLVWGADYRDGKPCLVNAVGQMLTTGGGLGIPSSEFGEVVGQFDRINATLHGAGINTDGYVSSLAAETLIRNFGEIKPMIVSEPEPEVVTEAPYVEPSDEALTGMWLAAMQAPAPQEVAERVAAGDPEAEYVEAHVSFRDKG